MQIFIRSIQRFIFLNLKIQTTLPYFLLLLFKNILKR